MVGSPGLRSGVDGERGQVALGSPSSDLASSPGHGDQLSARRMTGGHSPGNFTQEEVIQFGGIPDQAAEGRRLSCRLQGRPEVDDMQQRCAVRAAKLRISLGSNEGEVSNSINDLLDLEAERALELIRNLAVVKPMNDSEIDALGVRVLDDFCADLAPPLQEQEEEDENVEMVVVSPPETGREDRVRTRTSPKRKWKRKIYPMSAFRVRSKVDGFDWSLVEVYGAAQAEFKPDFLADLVRVSGSEQLPILVGGDFNIIRRRDEKNNDNSDGRWSFMFNTIIESLDLREIELSDSTAGDEKDGEFQVQPRWRKFLAHVGPGALVAIGFLDPSNLETDMQAGADCKYELLWVILVGMIFALFIQTLSANLGVKTGKHLAELCREGYPPFVNIRLWIIAELAVISDDIPEVLGTAFAFNILFKIPVWAGVILTVFSTVLLLGVQRFGARKLEFIIAAFMFTMAGCFFGELSYVSPSAREVTKGMFVPSLRGKGAAANAIALFGAIITPYNLFLHSALVLSWKTPRSNKSIRAACRYFLIECGLAFVVAFLVAGSICSANNLSPADAGACGDLTPQSAPLLLRNVLGRSSSVVYVVALLASGQSTTISCTFAGQVIMQGFLDMKMKNWVRNLITRVIAIAPSLIVSIVSSPSGAGKLIILSSMILSFEMLFALIPLLKFCNSNKKVGPLKESIYTVIIAWALSVALIIVNTYFLVWTYIDWLAHNHLPRYTNVLVSVVIFALMAAYLVIVVYLTFRKDMVVTYVPVAERVQGQAEAGRAPVLASGADGDQPALYRKDLADASM
ncbi:metal transporter NRAT1-like [Triticum dicoccoides]|uniref:metal transporter NRAT1-like n=1 Tax=Triticum dicoccoides TaxID=85692 RepID=UPI00189122BF|nr:metal transporter NRAT1-like [Triticum dicoccoides]